MYEKIIVATDGSSCGNRAINSAADLAVKYDAKLTVVHVLMHGVPPESLSHMAEIEHLVDSHPDAGIAFNSEPTMALSVAEMRRNRIEHAVIEAIGEKVLQRSVHAAREAGAPAVSGHILEGDTAERIIEAARDQNVNLIVMGCRGLSTLKRILMGSVSQKVTQLAECACLIVR
jgi:nucleotide-binding universal stress UspA family protein